MSSIVTQQRSPYLEGNYAPVDVECTADLEVVEGAVPSDLRGVFVRNGSNPRFEPRGRYHWFDGDGMIHAVHFDDSGAHYRNRWVRTEALAIEEDAGESLWTGILEPPDFSRFPHVFKDTGNTDLVWFNGELLALWWLGGDAYQVDLPSLETRGRQTFEHTLETHIAAHPKVDPVTGELLYIDFDPVPPYLTFGTIGPDGRVSRSQSVELGGPRLQHDLAFTEDYVVLFDFPFMWEGVETPGERTRTRLAFHRELPSRFGLLPRRLVGGDPGDGVEPEVRWFETDPCFMYHVANAWQTEGEVHLIGCEIADPLAEDAGNPADLPDVPAIAMLRLEPYLTEWTFDLATGAITKQRLSDEIAEFPVIDVRRTGREFRSTYLQRFGPSAALAFDAVIRHDHVAGTETTHEWPTGWHGSETAFCPRAAGDADDDGYLVTFVVEEGTGRSEVHVLDAARLDEGPVCRLAVPVRVPAGYHTAWVPEGELTS